ncbi:hypothetical protein ASD00_36150 [Ensifer sp. Root31]|uniref:hypothetical protein n=1 Tax=Ensifer sp. Root31 TaxID=1736512 RepID=UPI00070F80DC|nr:hypothetical protein [Ensifer sp. Root31]KQU79839.1 hypothetical protein ASD00_36150 [Ensifer sp. Root31]
MKKIRDFSQIIGLLENGQLNPALSGEVSETLNKLYDMSEGSQGATFKGSTTLKLSFTVKDGMATIAADFSSITPKRPRKNSVFWVVEDGALSTEHPRQHDMFTPRAVSSEEPNRQSQ